MAGRFRSKAALIASLALVAAAAYAASTGSAAPSQDTLVVDRSFEIRTSDPQRAFEPTASIINRGVYDTLLTFKGADVSRPVPLAASSFRASRDAKTYTFQLRRDIRFADGTPMTAADVVFSFRRLVNLKGNPSFLLAGVTTSARGTHTVVLRSATPNTAIPAIVANTSLGIVNSKLARAHGATDGPGADKKDKAEKWFNSAASKGAGSGPYVLTEYSTTSRLVLDQNSRYWGRKPAFERVVVRNMVAATQFINVQRGKHEVAIDLSAQQAESLKGNSRLRVRTQPSTWVFWLFANNNPTISAATSNKRFQSAVRSALDYPSFVRLAGGGAIQARGIIPSMFLGSLPPGGGQARPHSREERARSVRCRRPDVHARVPERPHDQRRRVHHARPARAGQPSGHRAPGRAAREPRSARGWTSTAAARWPSACPSGGRTTRTRPTTSPSCRASSSAPCRLEEGR